MKTANLTFALFLISPAIASDDGAWLESASSYTEAIYRAFEASIPVTVPELSSLGLAFPQFNPAMGTPRLVILTFEFPITTAEVSAAYIGQVCAPGGPGAHQVLLITTTTLHVFGAHLPGTSADFTYSQPYNCPPSPGGGGGQPEPPRLPSSNVPIQIEIPIASAPEYVGTGYLLSFASWETDNERPGGQFAATLKASVTYYYDDTLFVGNFELE